jgi:hypothetical protein
MTGKDTGEPAPEIEATFKVSLHGALATIDNVAELAATLDRVLAERWDTYRGLSVQLEVDGDSLMGAPVRPRFNSRPSQ